MVNLEFENQVTVNMTMCAFTERCARQIHIMGTGGELRGNMEEGKIEISDFVTGERKPSSFIHRLQDTAEATRI